MLCFPTCLAERKSTLVMVVVVSRTLVCGSAMRRVLPRLCSSAISMEMAFRM